MGTYPWIVIDDDEPSIRFFLTLAMDQVVHTVLCETALAERAKLLSKMIQIAEVLDHYLHFMPRQQWQRACGSIGLTSLTHMGVMFSCCSSTTTSAG